MRWAVQGGETPESLPIRSHISSPGRAGGSWIPSLLMPGKVVQAGPCPRLPTQAHWSQACVLLAGCGAFLSVQEPGTWAKLWPELASPGGLRVPRLSPPYLESKPLLLLCWAPRGLELFWLH